MKSHLFVALLLAAVAAHAAPDPTGCDTLDPTVSDPDIVYEDVIQPIWTGGGAQTAKCTVCHSPNQSGNLSLAPVVSHSAMVNVDSAQDATIKRVLPGNAAGSLLFRKVNCNAPGVGNRMPRGRPALTLDEQRLIRDWINQGAIKNAIFASNFD
jgi:hypothetical protein